MDLPNRTQSRIELRERVARAYRSRWGREPERVLFAPGRVNLIGDHTDYSLLPVLPMAIERGIAFAIGSAAADLTLDSLDEPAELVLGRPPSQSASWHAYAEAALSPHLPNVTGTRILLAGDLPATGGLSSSSALVVGLLAALDGRNSSPLSGWALRDEAVVAERRAAIEGGEMDQTIIVFGEAGAALRIDFAPKAIRAVPLPEDLAFVAAFSGERAAKGGAARDAYNARVVAGRCATALLGKALGRALPSRLVLQSVQDAPEEALDALPESTTASDVSERVSIGVEVLAGLSAGRFPEKVEVPVRSVARHVLDEARAVGRAEEALGAGEIESVGRLLNASHASLRRFGSSTPALDRLTESMRAAGAVGARVTGAGFGGYAVAATRPDKVADVIAAAERETGGPAFRVEACEGIR